MSDFKSKLLPIARASHRYLQVAHLTPPLPLLLLFAPLMGGMVLASSGKPTVTAVFGALLVAFSLWGVAWGFNDLMNARRMEHGHSFILRAVLTQQQAVVMLAVLTLLALLGAFFLGGKFLSLLPLALLVAFTFPWLRRRSYLIDAWFALGIAWSVPLAFAAADRWPDKVGALLGVVTLLWALGWQVLLQWPHHLEQLERGTRSLGLMFGTATGYLVIVLQASVLLGAWMAAGQGKFDAAYNWLLLVSVAAIAWESWLIYKRGSNAAPVAQHLHLLSGVAIWVGVVLHTITAA